MTIQEALDIADEMKPNMMSRKLKVKYLTEIEQLIHEEIISRHEHPEAWDEKPNYTEDTDPGTEMRVPDPYASVYTYWLMTKIDIQNQEDERYNVDRAHFENAYAQMSDWWTHSYRPISTIREFRI